MANYMVSIINLWFNGCNETVKSFDVKHLTSNGCEDITCWPVVKNISSLLIIDKWKTPRTGVTIKRIIHIDVS